MRFIHADPALGGYEGHFYYYAMHCLRAAAKRGYDPILATNTDYRLVEFPPKIFPVYTRGVDFGCSLPRTIQQFSAGTKIRHKMLRRIRLHAVDVRVANRIVQRIRPQILQFSQETSDMLAGMRLDKADIVFFPTANLVTALGIRDYLSKNAHNIAARWCFLFKEELHGSPRGREPDLTPYAIRLLRALFLQLAASDIRVAFFTDSEQLANDYDRVAPGLFRVLPIPLAAPKPAVTPAHGVLTISYMGFATARKGYHHLPAIIAKLWADWVENGRMRFVIQSHIPRSHLSELGVVRDRLRSLGPGVSLTHDIQSNEEYRRTLLNSDIMLMPYDPEQYFAQTSNVCTEALTCGIPVVVPGGTWLARQFARATYEYQGGFGKSSLLDERAVGGDRGREVVVETSCGGASHIRIKATFGCNNTAPFFQVSITQRGKDGNILAVDSAVLDRVSLPFATCLIPIKAGAARLRVNIKHVVKKTTLDLQDTRATLLSADPTSPRSVVGMIYDEVESIPDCLENIACNYAHYRNSAQVFSNLYCKQHNVDGLINALTA